MENRVFGLWIVSSNNIEPTNIRSLRWTEKYICIRMYVGEGEEKYVGLLSTINYEDLTSNSFRPVSFFDEYYVPYQNLWYPSYVNSLNGDKLSYSLSEDGTTLIYSNVTFVRAKDDND